MPSADLSIDIRARRAWVLHLVPILARLPRPLALATARRMLAAVRFEYRCLPHGRWHDTRIRLHVDEVQD